LFGDLPAGINEPQQDNDDAPPSDLKDGQQFIDGIVRTLFTPSTNANWAKTMLIIVYDEHGGFCDHIQPPSDATPLLGQNSGKLGPRVPAFVVSAYTPARSVLKDTFDHATIAATILSRFCSPRPPVMSPRVSSATDLRGALSLPNPRGPFLLGPPNIATPTPRTAIRRFKAPKAADSFGSVLGGIALTIGAAP
jgi:phospholipase C